MLPQKPGAPTPYTGARTADNRIDPSPATKDRAELRAIPPRRDKATDNPESYPEEIQMRKGGKVKATGPVTVHKDEFVVKKAAAQKQGPKKMAALNAGKAKVVAKKGKR